MRSVKVLYVRQGMRNRQHQVNIQQVILRQGYRRYMDQGYCLFQEELQANISYTNKGSRYYGNLKGFSLDALLQLACMPEKLVRFHLAIIYHPVGGSHLWPLILVEEIFPENKLHLLKLFNPHLL